MISKPLLPAAAALFLVLLMPFAARADAAAGEGLAQRWCASCHEIGGRAAAPTVPQGPPSFRTVARRFDAGQIRAFLTHPHGAMPDLALTRAEIADLVAYIESLR